MWLLQGDLRHASSRHTESSRQQSGFVEPASKSIVPILLERARGGSESKGSDRSAHGRTIKQEPQLGSKTTKQFLHADPWWQQY
jgi:hypothetical protein